MGAALLSIGRPIALYVSVLASVSTPIFFPPGSIAYFALHDPSITVERKHWVQCDHLDACSSGLVHCRSSLVVKAILDLMLNQPRLIMFIGSALRHS